MKKRSFVLLACVIILGMGMWATCAHSAPKQDKPAVAPTAAPAQQAKQVVKAEEKTIKDKSDALQDQIYENKRQLLIERYNSQIKDFRASPSMQALAQQIDDASKKLNDIRIKMLKELGIEEKDYQRWKFDSENMKVIKLSEEEYNQMLQQQRAQQQ